jgi:hypothetical protein
MVNHRGVADPAPSSRRSSANLQSVLKRLGWLLDVGLNLPAIRETEQTLSR